MSYTALYRKFRPDHFTDVKGQEHIVTTLKNQIKAERVGHAYLFCGTRGTGKTTIAKIFAKTVNCEAPCDGSPCGVCKSCKTIAAGASMNVIEIDAASNNGVDNIREIREEVAYVPAEGKYKVYIIDEVHMLSIGAFNALLKTLEEPPYYVIFILATTEAHKIPITILSRCQRYDFKRIDIETITARLKELTEKEGIEAEDRALRFIAKTADGSMRDALSLLDQCTAFYFGQRLTYDNALEVLGAVDTEVFSRLLRAVCKRDILASIRLLEEIVMKGRDLPQFITDFTWYLRNLLLVKTSDQRLEDILDVSSENLAWLKEEAGMLEADEIMRFIRIFSELSGQVKYAVQKRVLIEVALIKLAKPQMETDQESLLARLRAVEQQLADGAVMAAPDREVREQKKAAPGVKAPLPPALPADIEKVLKQWKTIVNSMEPMLKTALKGVQLSIEGEKLLIITDNTFTLKCFSSENHLAELADAVEQAVEKRVDIQVKKLDGGQVFDEAYPDIAKMIHMDIEIEETE